MRVSISGSHSTGKTALAEVCYSALNATHPGDVDIIREVAREVISRGFPLNQDATLDSYINYILLQLQAERHATKKYVISDRSLVDLLAYIITNSNSNIPSYFVCMLEEIIWIETCYFDIYCYLPIEFDLVIDDVRPVQKDYQLAVDRTLVNIFSRFHVNIETITGNLGERREKLISLIENS